jgi:hypothetical protein
VWAEGLWGVERHTSFVSQLLVQWHVFKPLLSNPPALHSICLLISFSNSVEFFLGWGQVSGIGVWTQGFMLAKQAALPLELQLQSISLWLFWRWRLTNCLSCLSSNHSSDLSLPSSWDYRREPLVQVLFIQEWDGFTAHSIPLDFVSVSFI